MGAKTLSATVFDAQFRSQGRFYSNVLLTLLTDIRRISWDGSILQQKQYMNFDGIDPSDVDELASLSDIIYYYYTGQSDTTDDAERDRQKNAGLL